MNHRNHHPRRLAPAALLHRLARGAGPGRPRRQLRHDPLGRRARQPGRHRRRARARREHPVHQRVHDLRAWACSTTTATTCATAPPGGSPAGRPRRRAGRALGGAPGQRRLGRGQERGRHAGPRRSPARVADLAAALGAQRPERRGARPHRARARQDRPPRRPTAPGRRDGRRQPAACAARRSRPGPASCARPAPTPVAALVGDGDVSVRRAADPGGRPLPRGRGPRRARAAGGRPTRTRRSAATRPGRSAASATPRRAPRSTPAASDSSSLVRMTAKRRAAPAPLTVMGPGEPDEVGARASGMQFPHRARAPRFAPRGAGRVGSSAFSAGRLDDDGDRSGRRPPRRAGRVRLRQRQSAGPDLLRARHRADPDRHVRRQHRRLPRGRRGRPVRASRPATSTSPASRTSRSGATSCARSAPTRAAALSRRSATAASSASPTTASSCRSRCSTPAAASWRRLRRVPHAARVARQRRDRERPAAAAPAPEPARATARPFVPDDFDDGAGRAASRASASSERRHADPRPRCNAATATARRSRTSTSRAATTTASSPSTSPRRAPSSTDPVDDSQILRVPLALGGGGTGHTGGDHFDEPRRRRLRRDRGVGRGGRQVEFGAGDPGQRVLRRQRAAAPAHARLRVRGLPQPGRRPTTSSCAPAARASSRRSRWSATTSCCANEFMALEVPDARRGRAVAKTILEPAFGGIAHRGGPVLETPGSGGAEPVDVRRPVRPGHRAAPSASSRSGSNIEREALLAAGEVTAAGRGDTVPVVYVARQPGHVAAPLEFDTYQPRLRPPASPTRPSAPDGALAAPIPAGTSLLGRLPGRRRPGRGRRRGARRRATTASASRSPCAPRPATPLQIYTVDIDGADCTQVTDDEGAVDGILIHNFDPAWSPDGEWIVFASTRGAEGGAPAPTRSRRLFLPQSDIWRIHAGRQRRRADDLPHQQRGPPQFMREGRVTMTTEKVSDGFYQLAGRRINWDLTDYHPLLAQRAESPFADPDDPDATRPSVGYQQATEIREGSTATSSSSCPTPGARGRRRRARRSSTAASAPFEAGRDDPGFLALADHPGPAARPAGSARRPTAPTARRSRCPTAASWPRTPRSAATSAAPARSTSTSSRSTRAPATRDDAARRRRRVAGRGGARAQATRRASCTSTAASSCSAARADADADRRRRVRASCTSPTRRWSSRCSPPTCAAAARSTRSAAPRQLAVYEEKPAPAGTTSGNLGDISRTATLLGARRLRRRRLGQGAGAGRARRRPRAAGRLRQPGRHDGRGAPARPGREHLLRHRRAAVRRGVRRLPRHRVRAARSTSS